MKSRFSKEQIIGVIETARGRGEDGGVVPGTWDKRGDVYQWKSKFGGMEVSGAQR